MMLEKQGREEVKGLPWSVDATSTVGEKIVSTPWIVARQES